MSLPVFWSSFSVLHQYWTVNSFPSLPLGNVNIFPENRGPLDVVLPLSLLAAIGSPAATTNCPSRTQIGRVPFSIVQNPALSVPQKSGYNKKSKNSKKS